MTPVLASILETFRDGLEFIFQQRESGAGTVNVGGLHEVAHLTGNHFAVSFLAVVVAIIVSVPIGLWLGHLGRAEFLAIGVANIGRAVPALAIIAFFVAFLGTGFRNITFALTLLAIPPILTNTYVGMRQVDRELVDAARGQGLSGSQIVRQVELPLALATIFGGVRISAVTVLATAIIAPRAGLDTLGTPIISSEVYGEAGQIGAAIVIAVLTLTTDAGFALVQRLVTPKGLKVATRGSRPSRTWPISIRRVQLP
ncbi:MAG: ABC transporter permease [Chloroflexota bacterium]|nr:ABC transporter permease [Chloroflexota bacterium]